MAEAGHTSPHPGDAVDAEHSSSQTEEEGHFSWAEHEFHGLETQIKVATKDVFHRGSSYMIFYSLQNTESH